MIQPPNPRRSPDFTGVERAFAKVSAMLDPTPIFTCRINGRTIWCKAESRQPIGAFKLRGAWHRLTDLNEAERAAGVVAFSSGNHAQGVAWAAAKLGMPATIVMPSDAPGIKVERTKALGAEVVFYDRMREDRIAIAHALSAKRGATVVPPFDDPWIIEGQGSAGLEALGQLDFVPDLVVSPCGGGGLIAGLALAIPEASIAFGEPEGWDDMCRSLGAGKILPVGPNPPPTACDALQTLQASPLTYAILEARRANGFAVSETEIAAAMRFAFDEMGLVIEPGGAAGLAVLLSGKLEPTSRTLVVLSGGNVEPERFAAMTGREIKC